MSDASHDEVSTSLHPPAERWNGPILLFALYSTCILLMAGQFLYSSHRHAIHSAEVTTRNLAQILESRLQGTLAHTHSVLDMLVHDATPAMMQQSELAVRGQEVSDRMRHMLASFPEVSGTYYFDAAGDMLYSSDPQARVSNIADRPFFRRLSSTSGDALIFSDALVARTTGRLSVVIARGIRDASGRFLGVTTALFDLETYARLLEAIDVGPQGSIMLRRTDTFALVLRLPSISPGDLNQPLMHDHPVLHNIEAGKNAATLTYISSLDNVERLCSYKVLDGFPFYVEVALAKDHFLAPWHQQALWNSLLVAFLLIASGIAVSRLVRTGKAIREAAQRVEESNQRLELALRGGDLGLWDWNVPNGRVFFSERWCTMLGYTPGELLPHVESWRTLVHPADRPTIHAALDSHLRGETPAYESEHRLRHKEGRWVWVLDRGQVVERDADGTAVRAVGTHMDISRRKLAEEALHRSNIELEQYGYSISHDMRQPLRMISSYLQLLLQTFGDRLTTEQCQYFHFAVDGAQRLDAMLVDLLEYSRIGRKGEPPAWTDSRAVLDEVMLFLEPAIAEADARVRIEGVWPPLFVFSNELLRLLQNLIGNALKFRVAGRPAEVTVSGELVHGRWRLCVADNGIGILPNQAGRLFQVFQRLVSRADYEGTGIGLALCRKIVEHHEGIIWAESDGEGKGSRFLAELPLNVDHPVALQERGDV